MATAQVMLIGTYHFANPHQDMFNVEADDVLSAKRQAELQQIVEALATFEPTHVGVEYPVDEAASLQERYAAYRATLNGNGTSTERDEIFQLGARLAAHHGHDRLHPLDVKMDLDLEPVMQWAAANGHGEMIAAVQEQFQQGMQLFQEKQATSTIGEMLRWMNEDDILMQNHEFYLRLLRLGQSPDYIGAEQVTRWYSRNLKIFTELTHIAPPDARVVVVYGQGHIPILRSLAHDAPYMDVVSPLPYLA